MVKRILKSRLMPWVSLLIGLLLSLFIVLVILLNTDFFAQSAGVMFSRYLFHGTPFTLSVEEMSGNPLRELTIRNLRIRYRGDDFSFDVVRIEEIRTKFNILALVTDAPRMERMELVGPHVWIKPDSTGGLIIPGRRQKGGGALPDFSVETFSVKAGQVIIQGAGRADAVRNIDLQGGIHSRGGNITVLLESGSAESITREIVLRNMKGGISWRKDSVLPWRARNGSDYLEFDQFGIELEESYMTIGGTIVPDSARVDLSIEAPSIEVEEIARAVGFETDHFGELRGTFSVRGVPDSLRIAGTWNGILSGYALDNMWADLTSYPERIEISNAEGLFNGALVEGLGSYSFEDPEALILDVDVKELNLEEGFVAGRDMPETRFNGNIKLAYYVHSGSIFFAADLEEGHLRELPFERAAINGSYRDGDLFIDRIFMSHPTHTLSSHGVIGRGDTLKFYIDIDCQAQDTLFGYLDIEEYRADMRMNGVIEGTFDVWQWRSNGTIEDFVYRNAEVYSGDVKLVIDHEDDYDVFFDLNGDSCRVERYHFSGIDLSLEYGGGTTTFKRLHLFREGFDGEARGEVWSGENRTEIKIGELEVRALDERWLSSGACKILADDSSLTFDDLQLHSKLGALYLNSTVNRNAGEVRGAFTFRRLGIELLRRAGIVSVPLVGSAEGTVRFVGTTSDPDLDIDLQLIEGSIDTVTISELALRGRYSGNEYRIDTLAVSSPNGRFGLAGNIEGVSLKELYSDPGEALRHTVIEAETFCEDLNLEPFLRAVEGLPFTAGWLTGSVTFADSLVHPSVLVEGRIENLESEYIRIPEVVMRARIGGESIDLEGFIDITTGHTGDFKGLVPIRKLAWFYEVDDRAPFSIELKLEKGRLESLPGLTDFVAEATGEYGLDFRIEGTTAKPNILGEINLSDAGFRLSGMNERYHSVNAEIRLDDTLMTVVGLEGREGKEGKFNCTGTVTLRGWKPHVYDLDVEMEKFVVASIPDIIASLSGKVDIGSRMYEDRIIPMLQGQLTVNSAEIYYNLGDLMDGGGGTSMAAPSFTAEIDLDVPGNTWIRTTEARVELQGDVTLHHDNRGTYLRGRLRLVRGWYNVYNNKFRVKSGTFEFVHAGSFRPVVDIEAETRDPEGRNIYLSLAWHQDDVEPRLTLTHEDPGYSETDIWKMLGGGVVDSPNGEGASWDALSTAQSLAANYLENMLNSQMEGVTIELESVSRSNSASNGDLEDSETMIAIGKYLSEGLYVKYKQGLAISTAREIEVEYRISRLFLIRSQIIKYSEKVLEGTSQGSTDEINLDIKLRWEF
jgi:hypothetical protein